MKIINLPQRDEDWLEWRRNGITASDAAVLLGVSPYKTKWRLWAEKTGYAREMDLDGNPLVRRGKLNEDAARCDFEEKHKELLLPVCVESTEIPLMRASLDGLMENGEPVELKCPSQKVFEEVRNEEEQSAAYQLYYPQVQHQILVTGANQGWLVFYRDGKLYEILVDRDEAMIREISSEARKFWSDLEAGKAPEKDPERDIYIPQGEEARQWIFAAEEYHLCDGEIKALKQRLAALEARQAALEARQKPHLETLKALMGDFYQADYCGIRVTKYTSAGRVNYKRLLAEKAPELTEEDIEQYREKASKRCRVTVSDEVKPRYIVDEEALAPLENVPEEIETLYF